MAQKNFLRRTSLDDPQLQMLRRRAQSSPLAIKGVADQDVINQFVQAQADKMLKHKTFGSKMKQADKALREQARQFDKSLKWSKKKTRKELGLREKLFMDELALKQAAQKMQEQQELARLGLSQDLFGYKKKQDDWAMLMGIPKMLMGMYSSGQEAKRAAEEREFRETIMREMAKGRGNT